MDPERIEVEEVKARMERGENILLIDSRSSSSWDKSDLKIEGALRISGEEIQGRLNDLPRDRTIVVYCT